MFLDRYLITPLNQDYQNNYNFKTCGKGGKFQNSSHSI